MHHTGDLQKRSRKRVCIGNAAKRCIKDEVPLICDKPAIFVLPPGKRTLKAKGLSCPFDLYPGCLRTEAIDLYRQWKRSQHVHQLAFIGNDDHAYCSTRHDLFAQQRATSTLDQRQARTDFIGAVNDKIEFWQRVERGEFDAEFAAKCRSPLRRRDTGNHKPFAHPLRQQPDKFFRRRTRSDAKPHAVLNMRQRSPCRFDLVLPAHGKPGPVTSVISVWRSPITQQSRFPVLIALSSTVMGRTIHGSLPSPATGQHMPASASPTLVLDLDGTLADTNRDLVPVLNRVIGAEGLAPVAFADVGHIVGLGARKMIERAYEFRAVPLGNAKLDQLFDAFIADYEQNLAVNTVLYDGVEAALERFAQAGWILAICTNKHEAMARKLVAELGVADYFAAIAGGNTFPVRKPDPLHLTGTVEQAGGNVARAVMVGDSITDISAARAASIPVVAVDFGYSERPVRDYSPDHVISHYDQLWDAVGRIAADWQ